MSKYLAVIRDSFREAFASRVMWLVLIVITLGLLGLAPFGFEEVLTTRFGENDLRRPDDFLKMVRDAGATESVSLERHVWSQLAAKTQTRLAKVKIPPPPGEMPFEYLGVLSSVIKDVDDMLQQPEFYDAAVFEKVRLVSDEGRELRRRREGRSKPGDPPIEPLTATQNARLNRMLLDAAFPETIRTSPPTSVQFKYAGMNAATPQPLLGSTVREQVQSYATTLMGWFVGSIGVFVAILVTAPIIPQMFDAGSLHLLLSKPVSRWMLFLAKYLGGCAFILIAAAYLIVGLWLILGTRFGIWEPQLLVSIPIYLFVFAIYYSVSSLAAVIWRSPIVSIAFSILFWLLCFVVGTMKSGYESIMLNKERFTNVFYAKDTLIAVDELGWGKAWDPEKREWRERFVLSEQRQSRPFLSLPPVVPREFRSIGPIYDAATDRIYAAVPAFPPTKIHFAVATRKDNWEPTAPLTAPLGTLALLREPTGKLLIASSLGLSRVASDPLEKKEPPKYLAWLPSFGSGPFQNVNPDPAILLTQPADATIDPTHGPTAGRLALYARGKVSILAPQRSKYELQTEYKLDGKDEQPALVGLRGNLLILGRNDGRIQLVDLTSRTLVDVWQPEGKNPPRFIEVSPDGRWVAIVFHTSRLWLLDLNDQQLRRPRVTGQGKISAAKFTDDSELLVVDRTDRVTQYRLDPLETVQRFSPNSGFLLNLYRYALVPIYTIFPKPGELDETLDFLLSGKETTRADNDLNLTTAQQTLDPWTPVWSSGLFTVLVLAVACLYLEWQEF